MTMDSDASSDYVKQLEIIRKIRDTITIADEINLPQICVIGDQSSGKSSFLSRLTGISFPTAGKMCTKAATVVTCNRDESLVKPRYEIEEWDCPGSYKEIESTADSITKTQNGMLKKAADGGNWSADDNKIIADQSIKLRVTSPKVIDIIIVDLPGIQHAGDTKEAINRLIEDNIKKPETLILIVSEAKQDAELTRAIELASNYDPNRERTIRVLSKFDNFDTNETRERAVKLIKEGLQDYSALLNKVNLGPHAVISIGSDGVLRTSEKADMEEQNQLAQEYHVPESRAGIRCLEQRLQPLFANLIKTNLPKLKLNVAGRLEEAQQYLAKIGAEPPSPFEILQRCYNRLKDQTNALELTLTHKCFLLMKTDIVAIGKNITLEFATSGFEMNSFECILFQGKTRFDKAAKDIKCLWHPIVSKYMKLVRETMMESILCLHKDDSINIYGPMVSRVEMEYQNYMQANVFPEFDKTCMEALQHEGFFGTTNHYFDSKFREDEICPEPLIQNFMQKARALLSESSDSKISNRRGIYDMAKLERCLRSAKQEEAEHEVHTDLMTTQKKRVFAAVKAHFDVEKKTLPDILLKKTKELVLRKGHKEWIRCHLLCSQTIAGEATEDKRTAKLREDLKTQIERLNECMTLLCNIPLPPRGNKRRASKSNDEQDDETTREKNMKLSTEEDTSSDSSE